jgi:hypothetical protein
MKNKRIKKSIVATNSLYNISVCPVIPYVEIIGVVFWDTKKVPVLSVKESQGIP